MFCDGKAVVGLSGGVERVHPFSVRDLLKKHKDLSASRFDSKSKEGKPPLVSQNGRERIFD